MISIETRSVIKSALKSHVGLPLRSENYDLRKLSFLDLMAESVGLSELDTSDWQIIYGRRGTGKTHLLRSFLELKSKLSNSVHRENRELCLYFSAQDFRVSEENISNKDKATSYYNVFIDQFSDEILRFVDELSNKKGYFDRLMGFDNARIQKVEDLVLHLKYSVQIGEDVLHNHEQETLVEEASSKSSSREGAAQGKLELKSYTPVVEVSLTGKADVKAGKTAIENTKRRVVKAPRYDKVRKYLIDLMDMIDLNRIYILIDEWALIDPTGITSMQPEFANLLRKTFMGDGRISVKIASNRFQTRLSERDELGDYKGLELDADIFEAVNLDHALLAEDELSDFYELMIFKRLCACSSEFASHFMKEKFKGKLLSITLDDVPKGFVETIFKDRSAFVELTRGCEGIPREFLELFNRLSKKQIYSVREKWSIPLVRDAIRESKIATNDNLEWNSPSYKFLNLTIKGKVLESRRREISIASNEFVSMSGIIDILLERRILHEYPLNRVPEECRENYKIFLIDYGYCLDWLRSFEALVHKDALAGLIDNSPLTRPAVDRVCVKGADIERDGIESSNVECQVCKLTFSPEAPSYVKKGLCPHCFEPAK